jgi:hypothetical protein
MIGMAHQISSAVKKEFSINLAKTGDIRSYWRNNLHPERVLRPETTL